MSKNVKSDEQLNYTGKFFESHKKEMIEKLGELVAIKSESDDRAKAKEALKYSLGLAEELGMKTRSLIDDQIGVIEIGEGDETLGILTHVDVVPAGELSEWNKDPYKLELEDGKIWGRGTLDDKGMVIASLYAMKAVMESGVKFNKKVCHIIGTLEETNWDDIHAYVKDHTLPDYGFTPDGEFPICNIEKGVMDVEIKFPIGVSDADKCQDAKTNGAVEISEIAAGTAVNIVPGKAKAILSSGREVNAEGKAVHSCQPEKGSNAIFALADEIKKMDLCKNRLYKLLMALRDGFIDVGGSRLGVEKRNQYYMGEFIHTNAFSPTMFNAKGNEAVINVDIRFPWGETEEHLLKILRDFAAPLGGEIVSSDFLPAVFVSKERPFMQTFAKAYEEVSGMKNEFTLAYGGSYAKAMPNIVSWGPIFPGEEDTCHEANEYINENSFISNAEIFARAIYNIVSSERSFK